MKKLNKEQLGKWKIIIIYFLSSALVPSILSYYIVRVISYTIIKLTYNFYDVKFLHRRLEFMDFYNIRFFSEIISLLLLTWICIFLVSKFLLKRYPEENFAKIVKISTIIFIVIQLIPVAYKWQLTLVTISSLGIFGFIVEIILPTTIFIAFYYLISRFYLTRKK